MRTWVLLLILTFTPAARATIGSSGLLLSFNGFMKNVTIEQDGATYDDNEFVYDLKFGYSGSSKLYYGLIHTTRSRSGSAISSQAGSAQGVSLGFIGTSGFFLMGHYLLTAQNGDFKDGSGYQGDFGYLGRVAGAFHVGVEISYRNIGYKKISATTLDVPYRVKELFPMLTAAFAF